MSLFVAPTLWAGDPPPSSHSVERDAGEGDGPVYPNGTWRSVFTFTDSLRDWVPVSRPNRLPETDRPARTGAAFIEDEAGNRLMVGLIGQLQYDRSISDLEQRSANDVDQTFSLRRLRWFITAQTADESIRMHVQINTTPSDDAGPRSGPDPGPDPG